MILSHTTYHISLAHTQSHGNRVFELTVSFPLETELILMVFDHNLVGSDEMIGETRVDLENRFYSWHRAGCGLALYYDRWVTWYT